MDSPLGALYLHRAATLARTSAVREFFAQQLTLVSDAQKTALSAQDELFNLWADVEDDDREIRELKGENKLETSGGSDLRSSSSIPSLRTHIERSRQTRQMYLDAVCTESKASSPSSSQSSIHLDLS